MGGFDFAAAKRAGRLALHRAMAADAVYSDHETPPTPVRVRWHTKATRSGNLQGGYDAEIIEGINKLVFQKSDLATALRPNPDPDPSVPGTLVRLRQNGQVVIPAYDGLTLLLDTLAPEDGPENIYWNVVEK